MSITDEQIKMLSSSIMISDVIDYINKHQKEYEEFLKQLEKNELKKEDEPNGKN